MEEIESDSVDKLGEVGGGVALAMTPGGPFGSVSQDPVDLLNAGGVVHEATDVA